MSAQNTLQIILKQGVLPLFYHPDIEVCMGVLDALYAAGIRAVEFTHRGDAAETNFIAIKASIPTRYPDLNIGIGTLKNRAQAQKYHELGADFLVSPGLVPSIAQYASEHNMLYTPGCMTPTEIIQAETLGITFVKLFPGNLLGPEFVSAIKELFKGMYFMPTGGVDATDESIGSWFKAGVSVVGMGSKLISKSRLDQRDYSSIEQSTRQVIQWVQSHQANR
ncbi:MAG: bifunctional 4-hydroxy-2-oxoglutarate aldolase/2-dehydro-3-deoxy-phosphogluconate aldolase [Flavobacterium sp. BFFFF2]|nr:MAG: bifunctional 4-hydroxy-2-oxoglutarate aldolase/2-dehydro-3-deoxy-phosphogluconate aldolase [Flavobacterium sp. BFFFF2]